MNYLGISDAYDLSRKLTVPGNPYGFANVESHLTKNSEWGAVAYLTYSKYGRNGQQLTVNNVSAGGTNTIFAVTGYGASPTSTSHDNSRNLTTLIMPGQDGSYTTTQGQMASTTGNIYGIYDLCGGLLEYTAGYIETSGAYETYGGSLKGESNKYKSKYAGSTNSNTTNYTTMPNPNRKGEALWEISTSGNEKTWNNEGVQFITVNSPFTVRGGWFSGFRDNGGQHIGAFRCWSRPGNCGYYYGFRSVLI